MHTQAPLARGTLIQRYKRFLADIELEDGRQITAHCPNPGSMLSVSTPGSPVWVSHSDNPKRKLAYTLELIDVGTGLVGINPNRANAIAEEALRAWTIPGLTGYAGIRREVRYGENSRIDLLLKSETSRDCYVEVKSVTLRRDGAQGPGLAEFPDAATKRGAKHLAELARMVENRARAVMLFVVQRDDCDRFAVARDIDPAYGSAFDAARAGGVEMLAHRCTVEPEGITLGAAVGIED